MWADRAIDAGDAITLIESGFWLGAAMIVATFIVVAIGMRLMFGKDE